MIYSHVQLGFYSTSCLIGSCIITARRAAGWTLSEFNPHLLAISGSVQDSVYCNQVL
ncbi:hypothetical protein BC835DRAFT_1325214 [Cytidiella melzeri]|nr:hypothetical protein BC835DRAFT_1325214 [Cytidiella melzeri]